MSAYLISILIEIRPEWCFLVFWIFLLFFLEFSYPGRVGTKFVTKFFFFLFLGLSHHGFDRNKVRIMFLNFWNFYAILLEFSIPGLVGTVFGTKIFFPLSSNSGRVGMGRNDLFIYLFFHSFLACLGLFRLEMKPGWCFVIFFGFLYLGLGRNGLERNFFFLYYSAYSDPFRLEMKPGWSFLNFFCFFVFNFLTWVG